MLGWTDKETGYALMRKEVDLPIPNYEPHWCCYVAVPGRWPEPPIGNHASVTYHNYDRLTNTTVFGWDFERKEMSEADVVKFAEEMAEEILLNGPYSLCKEWEW